MFICGPLTWRPGYPNHWGGPPTRRSCCPKPPGGPIIRRFLNALPFCVSGNCSQIRPRHYTEFPPLVRTIDTNVRIDGLNNWYNVSTRDQRAEIFSRKKCKPRTVVGRGGEGPAMSPRIWVATRRERAKLINRMGKKNKKNKKSKPGRPGGVAGYPRAGDRSISWLRIPRVQTYKFVPGRYFFLCANGLAERAKPWVSNIRWKSTSSGSAEPYAR